MTTWSIECPKLSSWRLGRKNAKNVEFKGGKKIVASWKVQEVLLTIWSNILAWSFIDARVSIDKVHRKKVNGKCF